ncbi:MAG: histidinol-phosphate aminotransferase family protein [Acidobacteria bacterium]|nr:histidinol-phosphate aminotransferase family protein [Acidobacteriota bacterium]
MTRIQGVPDFGPGLRLHLNENTGGCSPAVVAAVRAFDARGLATYPDYRAAVIETAAFLGVDPEWLVLTNGLDEGVLLTAIACLTQTPGAPAPEVVMPMPAFETYITTAKALGARIVAVPPGPDYAFPTAAVLAAVTPNTRLIYINNPNNPTGQRVSKQAIRRIASEASHAIVFVDEAYHDFMEENFLDEAVSYPNVLVGRTFSKAHGLAGMRVGIMVAPPPVLEPIRFVMPLFNLNVVAVQALRAALTDRDFTPWYVTQATESKRRLYDVLDRVGLKYWRSAANFVLVDGGARASEIVDGLLAHGVLVRDRTKDPYCPNCFRITAGVVEHTQEAVEALEALCANQ